MKIALVLILFVIADVIALQLYIRLAPTDVARWHVDPATAPDPGEGGARRVMMTALAPEEALAAFARVAADTPRTARIAGSAEEGRVTYRTRSRLWGFPDFTTIAARATPAGTEVTALARLRFGKGDMGVNAKRLDAWLAAAALPPAAGT